VKKGIEKFKKRAIKRRNIGKNHQKIPIKKIKQQDLKHWKNAKSET